MSEAVRPTRSIVVAAGMGRRLAPFTDEMPKCLVPVAGKPMLTRALDAFRAHGVDEHVVIRGYLAEVLEARKGELGPGVRFVENRAFRDNNILESLFCAEADLDRAVLITYADIVFANDVVRRLMDAEGDICLVVDRDFAKIYEGRTEHPLSEAEVCKLDAAGHVAAVGKRSVPVDEAWGEFIGLAKFSSVGMKAMTDAWRRVVDEYRGRPDAPFQRAPRFRQAYLTDLLQVLIDAGVAVNAVEIRGLWREIDTVQDLRAAQAAVSW